MNDTPREDWDWLAFRYLAAELPPAESREFECRLEQDQDAREAVGRVVELTCAVRSLDWDTIPQVAARPRRCAWHQRRGVRWAAGLALGLTVALTLAMLNRADQARRAGGELAGALPPAELALVWSHARTVLTEQADDEPAGWQWLAAAAREADAPIAEPPAGDEAAGDTPEWMVSAVLAMESEGGEPPAPAGNVEGI